ncbi:MAG: M28 family peptidase, partial [Bacteroidota bacterium]
MSKQITLFFSVLLALNYSPAWLLSQSTDEDAFFIRKIFDLTLTEGQAYPWLSDLSQQVGGRLSGSPQAASAVNFTKQVLDTLQLDRVWLQACTVPHWVRGPKEDVRIVNSKQIGSQTLRALALGNSIGTGPSGVTAEVIEVHSLDEVDSLGKANIEGKIVFYNRPMNPKQINTFSAYGGAVDQRGLGPSKAAEYGAVGAVVRSMTTRLDDVPHTGGTFYREGYPKVPAVAISTNDAELLSKLLQKEKVQLYMQTNCAMLSPKPSHNVIGEITGSQYPDQIILVGGHLDSWDVGEGAHDDGVGCMQAMDVLY